jgi:hypothetical protein
MPESDMHKKKRGKNLTLLALVLAWCALIWGITMVKIAHAQDSSKYFASQRAQQLSDTNARAAAWNKDWDEKQFLRDKAKDEMQAGNELHVEQNNQRADSWIQDWNAKADARAAQKKAFDDQREALRDNEARNPPHWWEGWLDRLYKN